MSVFSIGQVRPSQLLWTYGPGALVDLPNLSVITMGLERWEIERCGTVEEARLLAAVRRILGPQVERLRIPPIILDENVDPNSAEGKVGVPVRPFPRWLRCVRCGLLAEYDSGLFEIIPNKYRPELTHFIHSNCDRGANADAVPARFLLACRNGHLDDFPWHWFVHSGQSLCKGTLRFFESGASLQTENLWVKCDECNTAKSLAFAFGKEAKENLPACRGRHPHLDLYESSCNEEPRAVLLGSTNGWFPITLSVLAIPMLKDVLQQLIEDHWEDFSETESIEELKGILKILVKRGSLPGIERYSTEDVWKVIQERKLGSMASNIITEGDLKLPEWKVLTSSTCYSDWPHFMSKRVDIPVEYRSYFSDIILLERLREVNALIGFTRVEAPDESDSPEERPTIASLTRRKPDWVPANEVHGEGIFIRFNENAVKHWEAYDGVSKRRDMLMSGHSLWRSARKLTPEEGYPGIRYVMLHTFAHLLIRELSLECGYNAASIRERIYASSEAESTMAGVLIYTAAADSDGTLGGLVELGKPENLGRLVDKALKRAMICSSDPLCSEHNPSMDRSLHAAACHACTFVAETSCERGNRYLDRALLVETFDCCDASYFINEV